VPSGSTVPPAPLPEFAYGTGECPPENVAEPVRSFSAAPQQCIDPGATYTATFRTSEGDIVVDLNTAEVPGTVNNFVTLARYGYYDDTLIFRADPSIDIIQGGGRSNTDSPGYEIPDEANGFTYRAGQLAMARTQAPNSAGGQWFFVTGPNAAALDAQGTYVVFGEITEGLDVAQGILALAGGDDGQTPTREVALETVEITEA
jgi:cyclophilin family peptidyl-prolyl cis-trans isomerase